MKLKELQGIANNLVEIEDWHNPINAMTIHQHIEVDLISRKIIPDREGDDVEKFYMKVCEWFREELERKNIPINIIDRATIKIMPKERPECEITVQERIFRNKKRMN